MAINPTWFQPINKDYCLLFKIQESRDWSVPYSGIILKITYSLSFFFQILYKPNIRTITMVLYLHFCSKINSAELSLRFVVFTKSTKIFREHVISGLSLSLGLRFVSNHQPRLSFYRLIKVIAKLTKFKGDRKTKFVTY